MTPRKKTNRLQLLRFLHNRHKRLPIVWSRSTAAQTGRFIDTVRDKAPEGMVVFDKGHMIVAVGATRVRLMCNTGITGAVDAKDFAAILRKLDDQTRFHVLGGSLQIKTPRLTATTPLLQMTREDKEHQTRNPFDSVPCLFTGGVDFDEGACFSLVSNLSPYGTRDKLFTFSGGYFYSTNGAIVARRPFPVPLKEGTELSEKYLNTLLLAQKLVPLRSDGMDICQHAHTKKLSVQWGSNFYTAPYKDSAANFKTFGGLFNEHYNPPMTTIDQSWLRDYKKISRFNINVIRITHKYMECVTGKIMCRAHTPGVHAPVEVAKTTLDTVLQGGHVTGLHLVGDVFSFSGPGGLQGIFRPGVEK